MTPILTLYLCVAAVWRHRLMLRHSKLSHTVVASQREGSYRFSTMAHRERSAIARTIAIVDLSLFAAAVLAIWRLGTGL
jgi:hypothetical protein